MNPLVGAYNFRDLGGLPLRGGGVTRSGRLFRSDTLQTLTDADVAHLHRVLKIEVVLDLRLGREAVEEGRGRLSSRSVAYLNVPLDLVAPTGGDPEHVAADAYLSALEPGSTVPLALSMLAAAAGRPTIVHCAAGKDRTGLVTALVLDLVGVERSAIVADYLATAPNLPRIVERLRALPRYRAHMDSVPAALYAASGHTMERFLEQLDRRHGGAGAWAVARGVPPALVEALRAGLIDPHPADGAHASSG